MIWILDPKKLSKKEIEFLFDKCPRNCSEQKLNNEEVIVVYRNGVGYVWCDEKYQEEIDKIFENSMIDAWNLSC